MTVINLMQDLPKKKKGKKGQNKTTKISKENITIPLPDTKK